MFANVKIGEKNVPMLAMASSNVYYKRIFGVDPIRQQTDKDMTTGEQLEFAMQMGYVLAMAAEAKGDRKKMLSLNEDTYLEWLDQFENNEYVDPDVLLAVINLYNGRPIDSVEKKAES